MFSGKARKKKKKKKLVDSNVLRVLYETWLADTRGLSVGRLVCGKEGGGEEGGVRF
jgi:hypothetical protein